MDNKSKDRFFPHKKDTVAQIAKHLHEGHDETVSGAYSIAACCL